MRVASEKTLRFRYIRVLEKFVKRVISLLKNDDFDLESFKSKVNSYYEDVQSSTSVRLDSQYMQKLKSYAQLIIDSVDNHSNSFEDEKQLLLKEANLLHKEKNRSNYKKAKHKHKSFNDGY